MKVCYRIGAMIVATLLLVSCGSGQVTGNGKVVTKTRDVTQFDVIKIMGAYKVIVAQGNEDSVKVTTDSNVQPLIMTAVKDRTLRIRNKEGASFKTNQPVMVRVVVKNLKEISASGSNQLAVMGLNTGSFKVSTQGAIQAAFSGKVDQLALDISGTGQVDASRLVGEKVKVRVTGSGEVKVNAVDKLDSKITGSGTITYAGNPKDMDQSIVGNGRLEKMKN